MGITGVDIVQEAGEDDVNEELKLGFGKCRLCLQAPVADAFSGPEELVGKRIVTTFTSMARSYFDKFPGGRDPNFVLIRQCGGSVCIGALPMLSLIS